MFANYHTHTSRCQHATGEEKAYVEQAIQNGMKILGFSDHCRGSFPIPTAPPFGCVQRNWTTTFILSLL